MKIRRKNFLQSVAGTVGTSVLLHSTRRANAGLPNARRPNILLLFSDQHNAGFLGKAGHPDVKTPCLDRLISEGVWFNRAYSQDAVCVPSRVSMLTGQYPRTTGVLDNPEQPPHPQDLLPLPKLLGRNGYRTAAFGKRHLPRSLDIGFDYRCTTIPPAEEPSDEYYWEWVREQGQFDAFERDWNAEMGGRLPGNQAAEMGCLISRLPPENTMEAYTAEKTIAFLKDAKESGQPFFCWTSFYRPYQPYTPLQKYADLYDPGQVALPESLQEPVENLPPKLRDWRRLKRRPWCLALAAENIDLYRRYIAYYCALVAEIDDHIGRIMDTLKAEGLDENTIVLYASDHGDFVGAHGMIEKCHQGHNIYEDTLRVPLIMRWPGHIQQGKTCTDLVELVDVYPTLLDLTAISCPAGYSLPGRSLEPTLRDGRPVGRDVAISENRAMLTAVSERYKLGVWLKQQAGGYPDMLFDRQTDPAETHNLIGQPQVAAIENKLRKALERWVRQTKKV